MACFGRLLFKEHGSFDFTSIEKPRPLVVPLKFRTSQFEIAEKQNNTTDDVIDRESGLGSMEMGNGRLTEVNEDYSPINSLPNRNGINILTPKPAPRTITIQPVNITSNTDNFEVREDSKQFLNVPLNNSSSLSSISSYSKEVAIYSTEIQSPSMKARFRLSKEIHFIEYKELNDNEESDYCEDSEEDCVDHCEHHSRAIETSSNLDLSKIEEQERLENERMENERMENEEKGLMTINGITIPPPPACPPPPIPNESYHDLHHYFMYPKESTSSENKEVDELNIQESGSIIRKEGVIPDRVLTRDSNDTVIVNYPKSRDSEILIKDAIYANDFLNNLMDDDRLEAVTDAMCPKTYPANSYIIKEGDIGSHFFVSSEGTFEVVVDNNVVKSFESGVVFGELAILYKAKRFASIRVTSDAKVWMLERKMFQKIMMKSGRKEREENVKFLSTVSILKDLEIEKLNKISDLLKREFYATGSIIIRQGDPGDKFYIIRGGSVNVIKADQIGKEKIVGTLQRGAYFGEQALLHEDKRLASIIANPPGTECLTLNRIAFNEFLGGLQTLREIKLNDELPSSLIANKQYSEYNHVQLHELKYIGTLGVGGFGRVELVQYTNKQTFALKYLKKIEMVRQQQQEHAYSEKDIMLSCNSYFIVRLYKTYRDRKYLYFLMEACLGGDVWTVLQKHRYFDEKIAKFMTACVIEAFDYLHRRSMIYRDLKPENLMLDDRGYVKLVDFGFAKRVGPNQKTYTFAGTPEYVAPEIILNKGHDKAVDYWALGVFIHELLVGKPPFRGKNHMKTYNAILRGIDVIEMPLRMAKKAQILIKRLCRQSSAERLGNQKNGIDDIKKHPWFTNFDWTKLQNRTLPAPLIRQVKSETDLSNFDEYPKDQDEPPDELSGWDINF